MNVGRNKKSVNGDQRGFATILTVVALSIVLVTALLTVYIYVVNRARHYARIKESYKLINVMEEAAKAVRASWDSAAAVQAANSASACVVSGPTTDQCATAIAAQTYNFIPNCSKAGAPACCNSATVTNNCSVQFPGATADLCFDNVDNPNTPYCFYGLSGLGNYSGAQQKVTSPQEREMKKINPRKTGIIENFYARLDMFFEGINLTNSMSKDEALKAPTLIGWIINERKALAYGTPNTGTSAGDHSDTLSLTITNCTGSGGTGGMPTAPNGAQCIACGPGTGRQCASITACPSSFSQCAGWNPATQPALFTQEFILAAPGVCGSGNYTVYNCY